VTLGVDRVLLEDREATAFVRSRRCDWSPIVLVSLPAGLADGERRRRT